MLEYSLLCLPRQIFLLGLELGDELKEMSDDVDDEVLEQAAVLAVVLDEVSVALPKMASMLNFK